MTFRLFPGLFCCLLVFVICIAPACTQEKKAAPKDKSTPIKPTSQVAAADGMIRVLIVDGQNNHGAWPKTTVLMRQVLEAAGKFRVDISRTKFTWKGGDLVKQFPLDDGKEYQELEKPKSDPDFHPNFSDYDVVISNFGWNAAAWPEKTRKDFEAWMSAGGGLVVVHAADNSFPDWTEFNKMIGLGGWGGRTEKSGPYVYFDEKEKLVRDTTAGPGGAHGPKHEYQIVNRGEHPITRDLPKAWMHSVDELYDKLRGPAENMTVLATAWSDKKYKGTQRHEPMLMVIDYGEGRVFHTPMGHDVRSMECVGFQTVLVRGTEWAAKGEVTLTDIPDNFPSTDKSSVTAFQPAAAKASK